MKTLRLIGMALLAVVLCVNFTACSDDDDESLATENLEGTWGLIRSVGWDYDSASGEKDSFDFTCDPYHPEESGNSTKIVIRKLADNSYSFTTYSYDKYNEEWTEEMNATCRLEGKTVVLPVTDFESYSITVESLDNEKLVLRTKAKGRDDDDESVYYELEQTDTFVRMQ